MILIEPIPTWYANTHFRSRLEARWAVFFDAVGVNWVYEPNVYRLESGDYKPDFFLYSVNEQNIWTYDDPTIDQFLRVGRTHGMFLEIKPVNAPRADARWDELVSELDTTLGVIFGLPRPDLPNYGYKFDELDRGDSYYSLFFHKLDNQMEEDYQFCVCSVCGKVGFQWRGRWDQICLTHANPDSYAYGNMSGWMGANYGWPPDPWKHITHNATGDRQIAVHPEYECKIENAFKKAHAERFGH